MTTFIIPRDATDADIEAARPPGAGDSRCHSEPLRSPWVPDTAAVNRIAELVTVQHRDCAWWQDIIDGLRHAWDANELCDTWDRDDLADEIADQIAAEARRLTEVTEELVQVPIAALAAVARIRKGDNK